MSMIQNLLTAALAMAPAQNDLQSLIRADAWINSTPLTAASLKGKVVVVEFWTYTCINWLRTLSYTRAGRQVQGQGTGGDRGALAGVQLREGPGERAPGGEGAECHYPVAVDSDHEIWAAFDNNYWPASTSSMRPAASAIITMARVTMRSRKSAFRAC
jgi:hypothetical protein